MLLSSYMVRHGCKSDLWLHGKVFPYKIRNQLFGGNIRCLIVPNLHSVGAARLTVVNVLFRRYPNSVNQKAKIVKVFCSFFHGSVKVRAGAK